MVQLTLPVQGGIGSIPGQGIRYPACFKVAYKIKSEKMNRRMLFDMKAVDCRPQ